MVPPSAVFLTDTVVVYASPIDTVDADAGYQQANGTGVAFQASVQRVTQGTQTDRSEAQHGTVTGTERVNILFASDPGVQRADIVMVRTHHLGVALASAETYVSLGGTEWPRGIMGRWTVSAVRKT